MATGNLCYTAYEVHDIRGILIHSTGVNTPWLRRYVGPDDGIVGGGPYNYGWNTPTPGGRLVAAHAFVGRDDAGTIMAYQVLPWEIMGWHSGSSDPNSEFSRNANANRNGYIGIEMCEDNLRGAEHFTNVYYKTVELTAYLCVRYNIQPEYPFIIGHAEAYAVGMASNHADPDHWFRLYGMSMFDFREDVKARVGQMLGVSAYPLTARISVGGVTAEYDLLSVGGRAFMELGAAIDLLKADPEWIREPNAWRPVNGALTLDSLQLLGNKIYVDIYRAEDVSYVDLSQFAEELDSSVSEDASGGLQITIGQRLIAKPSELVVYGNTAVSYDYVLYPDLTYVYFTVGDRRYFKLRDIAHILSVTTDGFGITTDAFTGQYTLHPGMQYVPNRSEHRTRLLRGDSFAIPAFDNVRLGGSETRVPAYLIDGVLYHSIDDIQRLISSSIAAQPPTPQVVVSSQTKVTINGENVTFEAFNIEGSNYFRLRDLAYILKDTNKRFDIGWDSETRLITLTSGSPYTPDGSEMRPGDGTAATAAPNLDINISKDGEPVPVTAYLVGGSNFMKLRDVMELLDIEVTWDSVSQTIGLNT